MSEYGIFDIIGPIMIGPSSSHTAGAVKIAYMSRKIIDEEVKKVTFYLHGSFSKTYKGHGTNLALLAGILGIPPDDPQVRESTEIASKLDVSYKFEHIDLGDVHPNSVKIKIETVSDKKWQICGSSIGGGKAKIFSINGFSVEFTGEYTTLIAQHKDFPGITAYITSILAKYNINIAFMKVFRTQRNSDSIMIIESDHDIAEEITHEILKNKDIKIARVLKPI